MISASETLTPFDCSAESIALAEADGRILATVGVHPHDAALLADAEGRRIFVGALEYELSAFRVAEARRPAAVPAP